MPPRSAASRPRHSSQRQPEADQLEPGKLRQRRLHADDLSANGYAVTGRCDNESLLLTPTELPPGEAAGGIWGVDLQTGKSLHGVSNTKVGAPILILDEVELASEHLTLFASGRSAVLDLTVAWTPGNCLVAGTASSS